MDDNEMLVRTFGFTRHQFAVLKALIDSIVPEDEFPSGTEAGVLDYLAVQFGKGLGFARPHYRLGVAAIDAEAHAATDRAFTQLDEEERQALLRSIEHGAVRYEWPIDPSAFFGDVVGLVMEGFYGDPGNGGNRNGVSWQMIGFQVTD